MSDEKALWELEQGFWLRGPDFYERSLATDALMVLPQPAGILDRAASIAAIGPGARWQQVQFSEQRLVLPARNTAILVYGVEASRGDADIPYVAYCSSTYLHDGVRWLLLLHHQTPQGQLALNGG